MPKVSRRAPPECPTPRVPTESNFFYHNSHTMGDMSFSSPRSFVLILASPVSHQAEYLTRMRAFEVDGE